MKESRDLPLGEFVTLMAEVREMADLLEERFVMLSSRDAAAMSMAVNLGFGPSEIAAALDITPGNAKVVLHRARKRLREAMADSDRPPAS